MNDMSLKKSQWGTDFLHSTTVGSLYSFYISLVKKGTYNRGEGFEVSR